MDPKRKTQLGRFISLILRHEPEQIGLELDSAGWASVDALLAGLARKRRALSFDELVEIVLTNDKQRYVFNADRTRIRARQGHSLNLNLDLQLEPRTAPPVLYHGTATRFLAAISTQGLQKRQRHHVHLSAARETALQVGRRHGTPVVLVIDAAAMQRDGCLFYQSENGVWLTAEVAPRYFHPETPSA